MRIVLLQITQVKEGAKLGAFELRLQKSMPEHATLSAVAHGLILIIETDSLSFYD